MKQRLASISIIGLLLTFFTGGAAVPDTAAQASLSYSVQTSNSSEASFTTQSTSLEFSLSSGTGEVDSGYYVLAGESRDSTSVNSGANDERELFEEGELTSSTLNFALTDGFYALDIFPEDPDFPNLVKTTFWISIQGSTVNVNRTDNTPVTPSGGVYTLVIYTANLSGNLLNPTGNENVVTDFDAGIYYDVFVLAQSGGDQYYENGLVFPIEDDGTFSAYVPNGTYKLRDRKSVV